MFQRTFFSPAHVWMLPECTKLHFGRILYGHNLINTLLYNYKAPCIIHKCKKWIFDAKFMERILNLTGQRIVKMQPDKKLSKCSIVKRVFVIIVDLIIYVGTQSRKTKAFAYLLKGLVCSTVQWIRFHLYQGFIKQSLIQFTCNKQPHYRQQKSKHLHGCFGLDIFVITKISTPPC